MGPKDNIILLLFLFCCIILFNSARAICVPRNQNFDLDVTSPSASPSRKSQSSPSPPVKTPASAPVSPSPKSQPPPSPPPPSPPPTPASATADSSTASKDSPDSDSSPTPSPTKPKPLSISLPTVSTIVGAGSKILSDPKIKALCAKTDEPDLCLSTIAPVFNGKTDLMSVVEMLIKAGTDQTKQAIATATKMAADPKYSDPKSVSRFNDCKEIYDDALDNLQEALDAIPTNDVGTIQTMLSAAISDYGTCDDGFTGQPDPNPEGVSPMVKINKNLMDIVSIMLSLANMIP